MLGRLSLVVCQVTAPITRRLAKETREEYDAVVSSAARSRSDLLLVALAWLMALLPWFLAGIVIDLLGRAAGLDRGWTNPVLLPGLAAITAGAVYYGLRSFLGTEPIRVRRSEDLVPVAVFLGSVVVAITSAT